MKKKTSDYVAVVIGVALLFTGLYLWKSIVHAQGTAFPLPYVCIGLGCGIFGHGMGNIISRRSLKNHPEMQKQIDIETNDERNITISNQAKAKAYDMMIFVFGALMVSFAIMNVDLTAILLLVAAYLFVVGYGIYFRCKYDKEM
ncbi:MAG: hypothetical protein J6J86_00430 [Lachnospiraceae bacterium]|nr:hypothetical protein [Lachnospiraceae bacterium]